MDPFAMTAVDAAAAIRDGALKSQDLVRSCLDRIAGLEEEVRAWTCLDEDYALGQAVEADRRREAGLALGPLHGLPVGIKDIFDTRDMPTENGTQLHAGRRPERDATVVALLREAGAVIMGKTVTTELAYFSPGKTRNPHDPERTPGGSSSGSAAAVAAGMIPLALGSQTAGSVIRPASYCGAVGFKPSHGLISRHGVLCLSRFLDTVGVFARSVPDAALIADTLMAYDQADSDMQPRGRPRLLKTAHEDPPLPPSFALVGSPVWDQAEPETREAFGELAEILGEDCDQVDLPEPFDRFVAWHRAVMCADFAMSFQGLYQRGKDQLSPVMVEAIEEGQACLAVDYNRIIGLREVLRAGLAEVFERYDAILTPASTGVAPLGKATGSPIFCTLWTYCGLPAVSLPLLQGASGMPLGVQLVGPWGEDARLLRTARALVGRVERENQA